MPHLISIALSVFKSSGVVEGEGETPFPTYYHDMGER